MGTPPGKRPVLPAQLQSLLDCAGRSCGMTEDCWRSLAEAYGDELYGEVIYRLCRLEMEPRAARDCLFAIIARQEELTATLGREVNLLTALCDYVLRVEPLVRQPVLMELCLLRHKEDCAYKDELTGLFNRRTFNQEIPREMERFRRCGSVFALLLLDLDHFKTFNDSHGHLAGDQALRDVAGILGGTARSYDRVVRYGGEEFAVILPQTTGNEALAVAERIRANMKAHSIHFEGEPLGELTVSIGMAAFPHDALEMRSLVRNADTALYRAKKRRNCVRAYHDARRIFPRAALTPPLPIRLEIGNHATTAVVLNVSLGGLLCEWKGPAPAAAASLRLELADAQRGLKLPIMARVRRVQMVNESVCRLGLSFTLHSPEEQMRFLSLVGNRMEPAGHGPLGPRAAA